MPRVHQASTRSTRSARLKSNLKTSAYSAPLRLCVKTNANASMVGGWKGRSISRSGNEGSLPTIGVHAHAAVLPRSRLPAVIGSIRVGGCPDRDRTLEGKPAHASNSWMPCLNTPSCMATKPRPPASAPSFLLRSNELRRTSTKLVEKV